MLPDDIPNPIVISLESDPSKTGYNLAQCKKEYLILYELISKLLSAEGYLAFGKANDAAPDIHQKNHNPNQKKNEKFKISKINSDNSFKWTQPASIVQVLSTLEELSEITEKAQTCLEYEYLGPKYPTDSGNVVKNIQLKQVDYFSRKLMEKRLIQTLIRSWKGLHFHLNKRFKSQSGVKSLKVPKNKKIQAKETLNTGFYLWVEEYEYLMEIVEHG